MFIPIGSFCTGIGAPEVAARGTPFKPVFFSEIDAFPSAVLAHHWPGVPNLGDFTAIDDAWLQQISILVAGTPCQAFSIAGLRRSLDDDRGNLTLQFVKKVHAAKSLFCAAWENVPGVLSTKDNAFGCFLAALVGADAPLHSPLERGRWPDAGMVSGPRGGAAWRLLDAQHFGVPQRRKRVILIFCPTASGGDPAAILFEPKGMPGDFEAGGEAGEIVAALTANGVGTCGADDNQGQAGHLIPLAFGGGNCSGPLDVTATLTAKGNRQDFEVETFIASPIAPPLTGNPYGDHESREGLLIANTLKAEGFDASEDGTGRTNLIPVLAFDCKASGQNGFGVGEVMSTLRSMGHSNRHQNGGGHAAIAFALRGREDGAQVEISGDQVGALRAANGGSSRDYVAASAVRRLTPVECERLQGFPDGHTQIPFGAAKKIIAAELLYLRLTQPELTMEEARRLAADGPRYKACGNSMAVPKIRWLWLRILADMERCGWLERFAA